MVTATSIYPKVEEGRYLALLRAANAVATSGDCSKASDILMKELRDVTSFDYLHLVAFDKKTTAACWSVLEVNGKRIDKATPDAPSLQNSPIQQVHELGQPLVIDDWSRENRFEEYARFLAKLGIASTCTLPLMQGARHLGVLSIGRFYPNAYDEEEIGFLRLASEQISLAIDAAVNFYLSQQSQERLELVLDLTNKVVSNLEFHDLLVAASSSVRQVMHCDAAAVMLADEDGAHLRVHALDYPDSRGIFVEGNMVLIEGTLPGDSFKSGRPIVVNRLDPVEMPPETYKKAFAEGLNSFCYVPLASRNRLLGVLAVARREESAFISRCR